MSESEPLVSVVIPTYNSALTLAEAIESVLNQTYSPIEILVVNDGSTDNTVSIVKPYLDKVIFFSQDNRGLGSARNLAMRNAHGSFIAWLDADDIFKPDKLEKQIKVIKQDNDIGLVCSDFSAFSKQGLIANTYIREYYSVFSHYTKTELFPNIVKDEVTDKDIAQSGIVFDKMIEGNFVHPPTVMFRTSLYTLLGPQNEKNLSADYEYFLRLAGKTKFAFIDEPLVKYRISNTQMSSDKYHTINAISVLKTLEQLNQEYDGVDTRHLPIIRKRRAQLCYSIALHLAFNSKLKALKYFSNSIRIAGLPKGSTKLMLKILLPTFLILFKRKILPLS